MGSRLPSRGTPLPRAPVAHRPNRPNRGLALRAAGWEVAARRCSAVPVPALFAALACGALAPAMTACARTTGLAWVNEPESGGDLTPPVSPSESERPVSLPEQAPPRRRLDHAITLGASEFDTGSYGTPAQPVDARAPTIVNVYITPGAMPYNGASYGYGGDAVWPFLVWSPPP